MYNALWEWLVWVWGVVVICGICLFGQHYGGLRGVIRRYSGKRGACTVHEPDWMIEKRG